jgi:hypothetical protein
VRDITAGDSSDFTTYAEIVTYSVTKMSTGDMDKVNGCPIRNEIGLELVQWIAKSAGSCMYGEMGGASYIFGMLNSVVICEQGS